MMMMAGLMMAAPACADELPTESKRVPTLRPTSADAAHVTGPGREPSAEAALSAAARGIWPRQKGMKYCR